MEKMMNQALRKALNQIDRQKTQLEELKKTLTSLNVEKAGTTKSVGRYAARSPIPAKYKYNKGWVQNGRLTDAGVKALETMLKDGANRNQIARYMRISHSAVTNRVKNRAA